MFRANWVGICALGLSALCLVEAAQATSDSTGGRLEAIDSLGQSLGTCPLRHTDVQVEISGPVARVTVTQKFHNPFTQPIEAVYVFPLSQDAAVDRMEMRVGDRKILGAVKRREEARRIFEAARQAGNLAGLLDQQRPNIFTQSVTNIAPGERVDVTLSYCELLAWREGVYHFDFPTVVGPRYIPGSLANGQAFGRAAINEVPDAPQIVPPMNPETRAGHDISIAVQIRAGLPIRSIESPQHSISTEFTTPDKSQATVKLLPRKAIPNKDFVLSFATSSERIEDSLLAHTDDRGNFFTLVLQPPPRVAPEEAIPRELVFVIDKSGSMSGTPIETAKRTMKQCIEELREEDTFNLMTFEGGVGFCFDKPVVASQDNRQRALDYLQSLAGGGGTNMLPAIRACLSGPLEHGRMRVVCFMTDGYVGNDMAIIDAVQEHAGSARVFAFGIGSSVNRYLLDEIARAGRGEVEYVLSDKDAAGAAERFSQRIRTPVLSDVTIDWGNLEVEDICPARLPDLFSVKPIVVTGRYRRAGQGQLTIRGKTGLGDYRRTVDVRLPAAETQNESLASLWARGQVAEIMHRDLYGIQHGIARKEVEEQIVALGLKFQLLSQFTSFVAVEEKAASGGREALPIRVDVPVELPKGVNGEALATAMSTTVSRLRDGLVGKVPVFEAAAGGVVRQGLSGSVAGVGGFDRSSAGVNFGTTPQGFGSRGSGVREARLGNGGTKESERAVAAALNWITRHQNASGGWSFDHRAACRGNSCSCAGQFSSDTAATALALLPLLAAGQTHQSAGPYRKSIQAGVNWLIANQQQTGQLTPSGDAAPIYGHALATLALCECYGASQDTRVGYAAQAAIRFLETQQNRAGGWYRFGEPSTSDTLLFCWAVIALRSAQLSGLQVNPATFARCGNYLSAVEKHGQFAASPGAETTATATAAGLAARQFLGMQQGPTSYLANHTPESSNILYLFFGTQTLYGAQGNQFEAWNRRVQRILVETQDKSSCAAGSWNPEKVPHDCSVQAGGRLLLTSLNALSLEIQYEHLAIWSPRTSTGRQ